MPRNGSGTMSVPNSFSSGTPISSSQVNANFTDVASELTGSLPRDGQAAMTGQLKAASGSAAAPGVTFGSDTDTGFYRKASGTIGIVSDGTEVGTISSTGITDANSVAVVGIPAGVIWAYAATTAPAGWVRLNGRTIGNASSGATERANADTSTLFSLIWSSYSDSVCAVSGGRGASAAADYAANKTIALPDWRGRAPFGLDDMGSTAAGRLGSVMTSPTTNGAAGGTETHTLTAAQLPSNIPNTASSSATTSVTINNGTDVLRNLLTQGVAGGDYNSSGTRNTLTATASTTVSTSVTINPSGGGAHSNMPPAVLTTFIIKL